MYETEYGIYNHITESSGRRPLASVALHPKEDVNTHSLLEEVMKIYLEQNIGETFKLSLIEFMDLPRDIIDMMLGVSDRHHSKQTPLPTLPDK